MLAEMAASAGGHFYFGLYHFLKRVQIEVARYPRPPLTSKRGKTRSPLFNRSPVSASGPASTAFSPAYSTSLCCEELAQDADS